MATRTRTATTSPATPATPAKPVTAPTLPGWELTEKAASQAFAPGSARQAWWSATQELLAKGPVARGALYAALVVHNGGQPPSLPQRGKIAGLCQPPANWLSKFSKFGLVQRVAVSATAATPAAKAARKSAKAAKASTRTRVRKAAK